MKALCLFRIFFLGRTFNVVRRHDNRFLGSRSNIFCRVFGTVEVFFFGRFYSCYCKDPYNNCSYYIRNFDLETDLEGTVGNKGRYRDWGRPLRDNSIAIVGNTGFASCNAY